MSAKTIVSAFVGFLGHYADEAATVSAALKAALTALPVDHADKVHILAAIDRLEKLPETIAASVKELAGLKVGQEVRVSKKDIAEAVAAELPSALSAILPGTVAAAVAEALEAATKPGESGGEA